jgi:peptide/nickel transport system substrate-binding protein
MRFRLSSALSRAAMVVFVAGSIALIPATAGAASSHPAAKAKVYLTAFQSEPSAGWVTKNFNPFVPSPDDFSHGAIYEPLMVITQASSKTVIYPWLATKAVWSNHNKTLTVDLRHGVRWSDGQPFTSADVVFTYTYTKAHGIDQTCFSTSCPGTIAANGKYQVVFHFNKTIATGYQPLLSTGNYMLPEHIWKNISNPLAFTDSNPVGTGPFTKVENFSIAQYTLAKNPYYWQRLSYAGIKVPGYKTNGDALAAFEGHDVDWAPISPGISEKQVVATDPKHLHYFNSPPTAPLDLEFNYQKAPFNSVPLRQAISMSINRKAISVQAEDSNEAPSDALGLKFLWSDWVNHSLDKLDKKLSTYNPNAARALLKKAGFTWKSGVLYSKSGKEVSMELSCPDGWSDWQIAIQLIAQELKAGIGMNATYNAHADQNTWFGWRSSRTMGYSDGALFGTESQGQTPYQYFWSFMSKQAYWPVNGTPPSSSWDVNGWYSNKATSLLNQFVSTSSVRKQHQIADQLQAIDLNNMAIIPTVTQAIWYNYSTLHFTGWPTPKHYYAYAAGYSYPDDVKVLTTIHPVK